MSLSVRWVLLNLQDASVGTWVFCFNILGIFQRGPGLERRLPAGCTGAFEKEREMLRVELWPQLCGLGPGGCGSCLRGWRKVVHEQVNVPHFPMTSADTEGDRACFRRGAVPIFHLTLEAVTTPF